MSSGLNPEPVQNSEAAPISVIMPVRDEADHLGAAVQRILAQAYPGELEIVIAVGPSTDITEVVARELARDHPQIKVIANPAGSTPAGLNAAIAAARFDVLVRVDGHSELSEGYLTQAVRDLHTSGAGNVGGFMDAQGTTDFERAVALAYRSRFGLGGGGFHLAGTPAGPAESVYLGVFRRGAVEAVGGFDETMHRAQDWELNYRLRQNGYLIWFDPALRVTYRPRSTFRALAKQFFDTGKWRREVVRRHRDTASARYLAPPLAVLGLTGGTLLGLLGGKKGRIGWLSPLAYAGFLAYATQQLGKNQRPGVRLRLPLVLAVMHLAWGLGFLRG